MATEPARTYPSELPALALRETVVFPLTLQPLAITRPISIDAVNRALAGDRLLFLALQNTDTRRARARRPAPDRHHRRDPPDGQGAQRRHPRHRRRAAARAKAEVITRTGTALRATVAPLPEADRANARSRRLRPAHPGTDRPRAVALERAVAGAARRWSLGIDDPLRLAYLLASLLDMKADEKQQILEATTLIDQAARRWRRRSTARSRCSS